MRGSWRLNKDCNILTSPAPPDIAVCRSRSTGLLNRGPGGPASLGHVLIPASSHQLVWSPNSIGDPEGPFCWVMKATTRQKVLLGPPIEFGEQTSWWEDAGMRTCPREGGPPSPRLSSPGERERHAAMSGGAGEVNMLQSLFSLQLHHTQPFQIKWELCIFLKGLSRRYYWVNMYYVFV